MPWSRTEGRYLKPMGMGGSSRQYGGSSSESLVPACACGAWHYATNNGELWWACVSCGARLGSVYAMILEKQISDKVRPGL